METERKLLKIAGILYGIMGVLTLAFPVYGVFLLIAGIYFFTQANESEEKLYNNRIVHYIISILGFVNIIGLILVVIAQDNIAKYRRMANGINAPPKVVYKVDKETKKIDILLKLGVGMVFVSGLLFATTSWSFVNNVVKAFLLILFGTLFLVLSIFTERRFKLYRSSYMYWILSMSLYFLTIVGMLYFGIFGTYVTYKGEGSSLAYAITLLSLAGFSLTTYFKFPKKYLLYACYMGLVSSFAYILSALQFSEMMNVAIISFIVMVLNIVNKRKGTLHLFSNLLSYVLFGFIIIASPQNDIEVLAACLINVVNLNYLTFVDEKEEASIVNIFLTYILIFYGILNFSILGDCIYIMTALTITIYTLLINGNVIPTKTITARLNYIAYCIAMTILYTIPIGTMNFGVPSTFVFVAIIFLFVNFLIKHGLFKVESWKVANFLEPILVFCLVGALIKYFHWNINVPMEFAIVGVLYVFLNILSRNPFDKKITYFYLLAMNLISIFAQTEPIYVYSALIVVGTCLYAFVVSYLENTTIKWRMIASYLLLITSLYVPFVHYNLLQIDVLFPALIFIFLLLIIAPLLREDSIKKTSYIYIILPLLTIIHSANLEYIFEQILESITGIYAIILIVKFFIKDKIATQVILIIGILFFLIDIFFEPEIYAGIYVGIVGIIALLIGYKKESYTPLFITAILITGINIIYRLKDVWQQIPFWLYLLIGGLLIIGFVTNRELEKQSKKNKEESKE